MFNSYKAVIGEDRPMPHREPKSPSPPPMTHDKPFKPSHPPKKGQTSKGISPFPKYIEDPKKATERRMDEEEDKAKFKPTHNVKSRPTPSVAVNIRNLKS